MNIIIVEDFYDNAMDVRDYALSLPFDVVGNYPGNRTVPLINDGTKRELSRLIAPYGGRVINWHDGDDEYTGSFQLTKSTDRSWIHHDNVTTTTWAGVLYLTPNMPLESGTCFYQHKRTGYTNNDQCVTSDQEQEILSDSNDATKWNLIDRVGGKFNRLVLYHGDKFHMSGDYFGHDATTGRLTQTFFFTTER